MCEQGRRSCLFYKEEGEETDSDEMNDLHPRYGTHVTLLLDLEFIDTLHFAQSGLDQVRRKLRQGPCHSQSLHQHSTLAMPHTRHWCFLVSTKAKRVRLLAVRKSHAASPVRDVRTLADTDLKHGAGWLLVPSVILIKHLTPSLPRLTHDGCNRCESTFSSNVDVFTP